VSEEVIKERVARSVFWIVWSWGGIPLFSFLTTLLVARLLVPSDFGLMAVVMAWTLPSIVLAELGLNSGIIQFRNLDQKELNVCFWLTMGVSVVLYAALFLCAPFLAKWFAMPQLNELLKVVGLMVILTAARTVPESILRKRLEMDKVSQAEIVSAVLTILVTLGLAWAGAGVWALVAGTLIVPLVKCVLGFWFSGWWPGGQLRIRRLGDLFRFSFSRFGSNLSWTIQSQSDSFLLAKIAGEDVLGWYSMAKTLAFALVTKVSMASMQLAAPLLAQLQNDQLAMQQSLRRGLRLVACVSTPVCLGLMVVADDLVWVVLTEKWLPAVPMLQVMCLGAMISPLDVLMTPVLLARYRADVVLRYNLALLVVMPVGFWIGAWWAGAMGAALVWVMAYPLVLLWLVREALREVGLSLRWFGKELQPTVVAALVMTMITLLARWLCVVGLPEATIFRLVVVILVGVVSYGAMLWIIGGSLRAELLEVFFWVVRPARPVGATK
jgi:O-antigen/teichoic acid export membrane protein